MERIPQLVMAGTDGEPRRFSVTVKGLTVGRDEECDVTIDDTNVSRVHARLLLHNGAVWVQDSGSRNGVFVNGKRVVRHQQLGLGDELTIGDHAFYLELPDGDDDESAVGAAIQPSRGPSLVLLVAGFVALLAFAAGVLLLLAR